jgi:hypothetical protein
MNKNVLFYLIFLSTVFTYAQNSTLANLEKYKKSKFLISVSGGFAWRVGGTAKNLDEVQKVIARDLKSGKSIDASVYYKPDKTGFGLKFNKFNASTLISGIDVVMADNFSIENTTLEVNDNITFTGPSFYIDANDINSKHHGMMDFAFGYLDYNSILKVSNRTYEINSGTFGMIANIGYRYCFNKYISVGPQVSFVGGVLKSFEIDGPNGFRKNIKLDKDNYENLWRIDLSLGATFRF